MTQPNQHTYSRDQIRRLARTGGLTAEVIARIEDAVKKGNVTRDGKATETQLEPKPPASIGGTEITAQKIEVPWWVPR
jgi:hypothetical protein